MLQRSLKSIQNVLVLLTLTILLTSCGVKQLEIFKQEVKRQPLNLEKPTPLQMEEIYWHIITSENVKKCLRN